jgi:zinc transporter 5/7
MASAYSLPTAAIPTHHHHHSSEHLHHHSQSLSQSPPSLSSFPASRSTRPEENRPPASSRRSSHGHRHTHTHDGNHSHRANSNHALASRPSLPPPLSSGGHWRTDSTAGGKPVITPTHASFDAAGAYQAPQAQLDTHHEHDHDHHHHDHDHHGHDHTAERSRFTGLLLPYTSRWPLLHAIMTEKDSRRIFYFMSYVSPLQMSRGSITTYLRHER